MAYAHGDAWYIICHWHADYRWVVVVRVAFRWLVKLNCTKLLTSQRGPLVSKDRW